MDQRILARMIRVSRWARGAAFLLIPALDVAALAILMVLWRPNRVAT